MHKSTENHYRLSFNLSLKDPVQVAIAREIMESGRGKATPFLTSLYVENLWLKSQLKDCYTKHQMEHIIAMVTGNPVQKSTDTENSKDISDFEKDLRQHLLETGILEWAEELSEQKLSNEAAGTRKRKSTKTVRTTAQAEENKPSGPVEEEIPLIEPETPEEVQPEEEESSFEYDENASFGVDFEGFLG